MTRCGFERWFRVVVLLGIYVCCGPGVAHGEEALRLKSGLKQLFIDERFFAKRQGIELRVNPPVKAGRVLTPEMPWEKRVLGLYTTVLEDNGIYRMWYDAYVGLVEEQYRSAPRSLCSATSKDGIHWKREMVNLYDWFGHRENNIVMPGGSASVLIDPKAPQESRYKALGIFFANDLWEGAEGAGWHKAGGGIHVFTSPDGIRWKRVQPMASPFFHDSLNLLTYDTRIGKYVAYLRTGQPGVPRDKSRMWFDRSVVFWDHVNRQYQADPSGGVQYFGQSRTVGRIELDDPTKTPWPYRKPQPGHTGAWRHGDAYDSVMTCDEKDPPDTDVQMATVTRYPYAQDVYLAMWVNYRHFGYSPNARDLGFPGGTQLNDGVQDVQLAVSRDGVSWSRPDRRPYVELGRADGPEGGVLWPTHGMLRRGDEIYEYYCGQARTHGDPPTYEGQGGIYRLVQRLDGFVSADAGPQGGWFTTPPLGFSGTRLEFNLNASALGYLTVEIQDEGGNPISGYTLKESLPIDRNRLAAPARWSSGKTLAELQGRTIRLHITMRSCKLYAFQFTEEPPRRRTR